MSDDKLCVFCSDNATTTALDEPSCADCRKSVESMKDVNADWRREIANELGMAMGTQAYNDAMGY